MTDIRDEVAAALHAIGAADIEDMAWSPLKSWPRDAEYEDNIIPDDDVPMASLAEATLAALAARGLTVVREGELDVERLVRAMTVVYEQDLFPIKSESWDYDARLIAAEYARLARQPEDQS